MTKYNILGDNLISKDPHGPFFLVDDMVDKISMIIEKLSLNEEFNHMTFVGKMYSKADLIRELKDIITS